jgi:transposase
MTGRDRLLTQTDSEKVSKRLTFVTRLSKGATLADAADDVGMSQSTGSRWTTLWNNGGLGLLAPATVGQFPATLHSERTDNHPAAGDN